jgi:hypothetical protein
VIAQGLVHGYSVATGWAAGMLAMGAVLTALMISAGKPAPRDPVRRGAE